MQRSGFWIGATAVSSSLLTYALLGGGASGGPRAASAAENPPATPAAKLVVDDHDMRWSSVNAYRIHTTAEEVVIDLGFNMLDPDAKGGEQQMLFRVFDRNVMSYSTAKRLQQSLGTLIQRYEQKYGAIQTPGTGR